MTAPGKKTHEIVSLKINPKRTPLAVKVGLVHQNWNEHLFDNLFAAEAKVKVGLVHQNWNEHLFDNLFAAEAKLTNYGIIVTGDFNRPDTNRL